GRGGPDLGRPGSRQRGGQLPPALPGRGAARPLAGVARARLPPTTALLWRLRDLRPAGLLRRLRRIPVGPDHGRRDLCPPHRGRRPHGLPARPHGERVASLEGPGMANPPSLGPHAIGLRPRRNPLAPRRPLPGRRRV
ncbi:MAG: hypothetical protein AVDCRST_MAG01-01-1466, partial [uncultured Rubrobacteraceae bacterium]